MITINAGGVKPGKGWSKSARAAVRRAAAKYVIAHRLIYMSQRKKYGADGEIEPTFTNCASLTTDGIIEEMSAIASLRPGISDPTRHVILSLEPTDRTPTREEIERMIMIYAEERGLKDAQFAAYVHTDGHGKRHPLHIHLCYNRVRPDGSLVPDRPLDMWVNRATSRRIENELGFHQNPGRDTPWTGSNRRVQRERARGIFIARRPGRHPEMMPTSAREEAEIFMRKIMRSVGKAMRDQHQQTLKQERQFRIDAAANRARESEARRIKTLEAERRAMPQHQQIKTQVTPASSGGKGIKS